MQIDIVTTLLPGQDKSAHLAIPESWVNGSIYRKVIGVLDGDTIEVLHEKKTERITSTESGTSNARRPCDMTPLWEIPLDYSTGPVKDPKYESHLSKTPAQAYLMTSADC